MIVMNSPWQTGDTPVVPPVRYTVIIIISSSSIIIVFAQKESYISLKQVRITERACRTTGRNNTHLQLH